jgi:hypothetical protein
MRPIYNVSSSLTTDPFAAPRHERDVATEKSLPNNTYSGRITHHPEVGEPDVRFKSTTFALM